MDHFMASNSSTESGVAPAADAPASAPAPDSAFPELRLLYLYLSVAAACAHLLGAPLLVSAILAGVALLSFVAAQLGPLSPAQASGSVSPDNASEGSQQPLSDSPEEVSGAMPASATSPTSAAPSAATLFATPTMGTPVAHPRLVKHLLAPPAVVAAGCLPTEPRQKWDELEDYLRANARGDQDEPALGMPDTSCCFGHMPEMPSFASADNGFDRY